MIERNQQLILGQSAFECHKYNFTLTKAGYCEEQQNLVCVSLIQPCVEIVITDRCRLFTAKHSPCE